MLDREILKSLFVQRNKMVVHARKRKALFVCWPGKPQTCRRKNQKEV